MSVSREEVRSIAELARLQFSEEKEEEMAEAMSKILDYVGTLDELDTSGVPPMSHPLEQTNVFRDDDVEARIDRDDALAAAPDDDGEHVRAPKAVE